MNFSPYRQSFHKDKQFEGGRARKRKIFSPITYSLKEDIVIRSESLEEKHLDWFDSAS